MLTHGQTDTHTDDHAGIRSFLAEDLKMDCGINYCQHSWIVVDHHGEWLWPHNLTITARYLMLPDASA